MYGCVCNNYDLKIRGHESEEWKGPGRNWREDNKGKNDVIQYSYMKFSKIKILNCKKLYHLAVNLLCSSGSF